MKITAIILTYNRPEALEVILKSVLNQRLTPDEVIIADDGSENSTSDIISKYKTKLPCNLKHVWHKDRGFRGSKIRNKATKASTGDWLIFSDGDLVFHSSFFYDFKTNVLHGTALIGSRVFLSKQLSTKILETREFHGVTFLSSDIDKNRLNSIRLPIISKLFRQKKLSPNLRGGLLAVEKRELIKINGWNEDFIGWGLEDTEIVARLYFSGIKLKKLKFAGITYHLWHPLSSRKNVSKNNLLLAKTIKNQSTWCENGLFKG